LRFLFLVQKAVTGPDGEAYRKAYVKGVQYLLRAQFPNGGWPQVWPLEGGYHDAITYNDNAVTEAAEVMTQVSTDKDGAFDFVPAKLRKQAAVSAKRALACVLATQVSANGKLTVWGQQHDALTLWPVSARNYEPPVLASDESANLLVYLMSLPNPSPRLIKSVQAGMSWIKAVEIDNIALSPKDDPEGRHAVAKEGSPPLWARYYIAQSGKPVFGERDKSLHDNMNELSKERRNGYNFYVTSPARALTVYESWSKDHPLAK
jgi:PelA/Pel-15E family pectate lyase